jgi:hypothetical protein
MSIELRLRGGGHFRTVEETLRGLKLLDGYANNTALADEGSVTIVRFRPSRPVTQEVYEELRRRYGEDLLSVR